MFSAKGCRVRPRKYPATPAKLTATPTVTARRSALRSRLFANSTGMTPAPTPNPIPRARPARGIGFGVGAGVIPVLFANSRLRSAERRAVTVGVAVSLAGVAGYFLGRTRQPLAENIAYNRALRSRWETRNRAIAAANERRRGVLLVRVRVVSPP